MARSRRAAEPRTVEGYRPYWSRVLRALRQAAGLTLVEWVADLQETPRDWVEFVQGDATAVPAEHGSDVRGGAIRREVALAGPNLLRRLREGIACSVDTVQRWETGRLAP